MIHIERGSAPAHLSSKQILDEKKRLEKRYRDQKGQERFKIESALLGPIKHKLFDLFNGRCAYCETQVSLVSGGISTFRPKHGATGLTGKYAPAHYFWLAYDWENLVVACKVCDQKFKRDFFPLEYETNRAAVGDRGRLLLEEGALLIDPCLDRPEEHLAFTEEGEFTGLTTKGTTTIKTLGLNRRELVKSRMSSADELRDLLQKLRREKNSISDRQVRHYLQDLSSPRTKKSHPGFQRAVFAAWLIKNPEFKNHFQQKDNKAPAGIWSLAQSSSEVATNTSSKRPPVKKGTAIIVSAAKPGRRTKTKKPPTQNKVDSGLTRFSIKRIEIKNFRTIANLTLDIPPLEDDSERESWLLILGDNGIGKSSILQAIALTLAGNQHLKSLGIKARDILKTGTSKGFVRITSYESDEPIVLNFTGSSMSATISQPPTYILGYGSTRLLPKGAFQPAAIEEKHLNVKNLFDYSFSLIDPNKWLAKLSSYEFKQRVAPTFFELLGLRGKERVYIEKGKVKINQHGEKRELEKNSDGYKSAIALVTDIMHTLSSDKADFHNSYGIVLIDELGNHLHPRWRLQIVESLRKAFPKIQFIVTTHEPLCLRGLAHGEVVVLVRDKREAVKALDKTLLPDHNLLKIDQLLTSDLFGLINVNDLKTEKTYEEYYKLLSKEESKRTTKEKEKINEISVKLAEKEILGSTPQQQMLFGLLNETYAKNLKEDGFKTKEILKKEIVEEVKNIIKQKKLDWL